MLDQEVPRSKQPGLVFSPGSEGTWDHAAIGNPVVSLPYHCGSGQASCCSSACMTGRPSKQGLGLYRQCDLSKTCAPSLSLAQHLRAATSISQIQNNQSTVCLSRLHSSKLASTARSDNCMMCSYHFCVRGLLSCPQPVVHFCYTQVRCYFGDNEQRWYMWYSGSDDAEKQIAAVAPSSGCTGRAFV